MNKGYKNIAIAALAGLTFLSGCSKGVEKTSSNPVQESNIETVKQIVENEEVENNYLSTLNDKEKVFYKSVDKLMSEPKIQNFSSTRERLMNQRTAEMHYLALLDNMSDSDGFVSPEEQSKSKDYLSKHSERIADKYFGNNDGILDKTEEENFIRNHNNNIALSKFFEVGNNGTDYDANTIEDIAKINANDGVFEKAIAYDSAKSSIDRVIYNQDRKPVTPGKRTEFINNSLSKKVPQLSTYENNIGMTAIKDYINQNK